MVERNIFRTEIHIKPNAKKITYNSELFFIGSCFSQNIGEILLENKLSITINPFGILYNPISIANAFYRLISNKNINPNELFYHNELWKSFMHHGVFSDTDKLQCAKRINKAYVEGYNRLKNADFIFITFGTSKVYLHKKTKQIVANCHKLPAKEFITVYLNSKFIVESYTKLIREIKIFSPKAQIVFTVSPIKHWKDGAIQNKQNKSILINSIHSLNEIFPQTSYFPAYEIMIDDLRDYRFYASDMLHPSNEAVKYIFLKYKQSFFHTNTEDLFNRISAINKSILHKPLHKNTKEYSKFKETLIKKIELLTAKYPNICFDSELKQIQ